MNAFLEIDPPEIPDFMSNIELGIDTFHPGGKIADNMFNFAIILRARRPFFSTVFEGQGSSSWMTSQ